MLDNTVYDSHPVQEQENALLQSVYNWMMIGLFISAVTAFFVAHSPAIETMIFGNSYMIWVLLILELGLVFVISGAIEKISLPMARSLFLLFSFVDGLTLSVIFLTYTEASIATTFLVASMTFGVMSLYGYFTDTDLSSWGKFLFMGLIGVIIAMVVNFFLKSPGVDWVVSVIGVVVFVGLTAYDTQKIKRMGEELAPEGGVRLSKTAIVGALALYLDFINLFLMLLQFFGSRRS